MRETAVPTPAIRYMSEYSTYNPICIEIRLKLKLSECLINHRMPARDGVARGCACCAVEMDGRRPRVPRCVKTRKTPGPAHAQGMRRAGGYPSDLTDAQWQVIVPYLPAEVPGRRGR